MWGAHQGMGWWMVFGGVIFVLFWGAIIWLMVSGLSNSGRGVAAAHDNDPLKIAERRYAKGEITRDQLQEIRKDLGK